MLKPPWPGTAGKHVPFPFDILYEENMYHIQKKIGCTPNSVPMVSIVFSTNSWGL